MPLQTQSEQVAARDMAQRYQPVPAFDILRNGGEGKLDWAQFQGMARVSIAAMIWGLNQGLS